MQKLPLLAVFVCSVTLTGCSVDNAKISDVKTDAVYQIYTVSYDATENSSQVYARLRVGGPTGTNLKLTDRSTLLCNQQTLRPAELFGRCYTHTLQGFPGKYDFVFTDTEKKSRNNSVQLEPIDFAATPERLSRGRAHSLSFAGVPLRQGETISLVIIPTPNFAAIQKEMQEDPFGDPKERLKRLGAPAADVQVTTVGTTGVELTRDQLKSLANGPVSIQWTRTIQGDLQEATSSGGSLGGTYRSRVRSLILED
jgi:hypothetical protein